MAAISNNEIINDLSARADLISENIGINVDKNRLHLANYTDLRKRTNEIAAKELNPNERQLVSILKGKIKLIEVLIDSLQLNQALDDEKKENEIGAPIKVALKNASQYDMGGDRPSACTFHAICALEKISANFEVFFDKIVQKRDSAYLSDEQREILNQGIELYYNAGAPDEGADFEHVKQHLPEGINLEEQPAQENLRTFEENLDTIMESLTTPNLTIKTMWIKNFNDESFAVISKGNRAIIFDSHKNEIIATNSAQATRSALQEKLYDASQVMDDGLYISTPAFAVNREHQTPSLVSRIANTLFGRFF